LELAILESLYNPGMINSGYVNELVKRVIRDNKESLDMKIWEKILRSNKHHSSINRLYRLVIAIDPVLSDKIKNLIKKCSYFIA
jgi:hypothetical protein